MSPPVHVYAVGDVLDAAATAGPPENASAPAMARVPRTPSRIALPIPVTPSLATPQRVERVDEDKPTSPHTRARRPGLLERAWSPTKRCVRLIAGSCVNTS